MSSRDAYTRFCDKVPDLPLFMQPWYLDAVCQGGQWEVALVEKAGQVVAAWPYFLKKKWHWRYVAMPPLARMMGPYLLPEWRSPRKEMSILGDLLERFPVGRLAAFEQDFNYTAQNWLPLYWRGFRQTTRYSYFLEINDLDAAWKNLAPDYRNQKIPKAREQTTVTTEGTLTDFFAVQQLSYQRQGLGSPVPFALLARLDEALAARERRAIFFARDLRTGVAHSVAYLAWDERTAWLLMAGDDPAHRSSGAGILLTWEAIRYASESLRLPEFDFAGSMVYAIERVRRQFGAAQRPYFRVQKEWSAAWKVGKLLFR